MTKEQEEAISRLRKITNRQILYGNKFGITIEGFKELQEDLETVLNMQKEKDAEIEKYKKLLADNLAKNLNDSIKAKHKADTDLEDLNEGWKLELKKKEEELEMYKDMKEIVDYKVTDLLKLKQYDDLKKKAEKQDKIIDLMADHIASAAIVDDTVCAIKCDCETDINEDCTYVKMLNCTKQYFERKATNDG